MKVSRTSSSPSKRVSIRISIRVRLRSVEIIELEMSPYFWPWEHLTVCLLSRQVVCLVHLHSRCLVCLHSQIIGQFVWYIWWDV